jgi:hypothetical protein
LNSTNPMNMNILFVALICLLGLGQAMKIVVRTRLPRKLFFFYYADVS